METSEELYNLLGSGINEFNMKFSGIEETSREEVLRYLSQENPQWAQDGKEAHINSSSSFCYLTTRKDYSNSFISFKNFDFEFAKNCLAEVLRAIIKYIPTHKRTRELTGILLQIQPPKSTQ